MSFAVILFILVLQFLSLYMNEIAGKGLGIAIIGKLFFYASGRLVLTALPVAILTAALMTFGNMGESNELAAIKSSGISLWRIAYPMVVLGFMITFASLYFSFDIVPQSNLKFFSLLYDVGRKKAEVSLKPGHFYSDIDGYVIRISDRSVERKTLYDVLIYNHSENQGAVDVISADSARTMLNEEAGNTMKMVLYSGVRHQDYKDKPGETPKFNYGRTYFDSLYYQFQLEGFDLGRTDEGLFARHQITLPRNMLEEALDSLDYRKLSAFDKYRDYMRPYTRVDSNFTLSREERREINKPKPDTTRSDSNVKVKPAKAPARVTARPPAKQRPKTPTNISSNMFDEARKASQASQMDKMPLGAALPDTTGTILDSFPADRRVDIITKALSSARAVKNYSEFMIRKLDEEDRRLRSYSYEFNLRHASPFNCIVFMLIGVSLGAIIRKGGLGVPSLISVTLLVLAYVFNAQGKKLAREGAIDPVVGAWLPIIIFGPIALYLTYKAAMESRILDENLWGNAKEKLGLFFRSLLLKRKKAE